MDNQNLQVAERVKEANNILVTVSANPSVDQLAACIGLTLTLNKMGKHATAVFSGHVPSTIEFLQPDKTLEKNTDSLRDFIISLDKSKADKLRYKVEDKIVKIFITPYKTSISERDLEFSQGDFNVDVVLAIGVHAQADLDQAITAHGRILHDATVVTLNIKPGGELGSINWLDPTASSLSELGVQLIDMLDKNLMDSQVATAMLTGIVAETDRFSNGKTSPRTMTISAELMTAGANQQLVATKLEQPAAPVAPPAAVPATPIAEAQHDHEAPAVPVRKSGDGTLEISHDADEGKPAADEKESPANTPEAKTPAEPKAPEVHDESGHDEPDHDDKPAPAADVTPELPAAAPAPASEPPAEASAVPVVLPAPVEEPTLKPPQIHIDEHGSLNPADFLPPAHTELPAISHHDTAPKMVLEPPTMGGQLTANTTADSYDMTPQVGMPVDEAGSPPNSRAASNSPAVGPTIMPPVNSAAEAAAPFLLGNDPVPAPASPAPEPSVLDSLPPAAPEAEAHSLPPIQPDDTLHDIEEAVHSSHLAPVSEPFTPPMPPAPAFDPAPLAPAEPFAFAPPPAPVMPASAPGPIVVTPTAPEPAADSPADVQDARDAVMQAINDAPLAADAALPPVIVPNTPPVDLSLGNLPPAYPAAADPVLPPAPQVAVTPAPASLPQPQVPGYGLPPTVPEAQDPNAPPPVPPPMMPPNTPYSQPY